MFDKGQVYRHLLFNRLGRSDNRLDVSHLLPVLIYASDHPSAIDCPSRHPPTALRRLSNMGTNRKGNLYIHRPHASISTTSTRSPIPLTIRCIDKQRDEIRDFDPPNDISRHKSRILH